MCTDCKGCVVLINCVCGSVLSHLALSFMHLLQFLTCWVPFFYILGQWKWSFNKSGILFRPRCPTSVWHPWSAISLYFRGSARWRLFLSFLAVYTLQYRTPFLILYLLLCLRYHLNCGVSESLTFLCLNFPSWYRCLIVFKFASFFLSFFLIFQGHPSRFLGIPWNPGKYICIWFSPTYSLVWSYRRIGWLSTSALWHPAWHLLSTGNKVCPWKHQSISHRGTHEIGLLWAISRQEPPNCEPHIWIHSLTKSYLHNWWLYPFHLLSDKKLHLILGHLHMCGIWKVCWSWHRLGWWLMYNSPSTSQSIVGILWSTTQLCSSYWHCLLSLGQKWDGLLKCSLWWIT